MVAHTGDAFEIAAIGGFYIDFVEMCDGPMHAEAVVPRIDPQTGPWLESILSDHFLGQLKATLLVDLGP
jgi:hypothetical protein